MGSGFSKKKFSKEEKMLKMVCCLLTVIRE
jgi:hypothetical protein